MKIKKQFLAFLAIMTLICSAAGGAIWWTTKGSSQSQIQTEQPLTSPAASAPAKQPTKAAAGNSQAFPTFTPIVDNGSNSTSPEQPTQIAPKAIDTTTPIQPAQSVDGGYPGQCKPGSSQTQINAAFDDYAGFYPIVYQYLTIGSDKYCLNLFPKWSGPNWDKNGWSESEIEAKMKAGEIDIYFGSNGALALWDSNNGIVIWTTDQSAGADAIVIRDSVTTRTDPKTGLPAPSFNDALGQTACTARGSADHYFLLTALQSAGFLNTDVNIVFPDYPVTDFNNKLCNLVAYWDPIIRDAQVAGNSTIITTQDWRTVSDYIVASRQADGGKKEALFYFLADFNSSTEAFTNANLDNTANLLIAWVHDGDNMAGWLFLDPTKAGADLRQLMEGVAPATLNNNVTMFESDTTGWNLVKDQFDKTHATMINGGITDNLDNTKGSVYDSNLFISGEYVKALSNSGVKTVAGQFSHKYITDINQSLPNLDKNTLYTLPEILTFKHKNIGFAEGQARELVGGEMDMLLIALQPLANQMRNSPDIVIVLKGGHGYFSKNADVMDTQKRLAFRRASYIKEILSDPNGLNIPMNRIVIDTEIIAPDHTLTSEELPNYMVVLIKVVNIAGLK